MRLNFNKMKKIVFLISIVSFFLFSCEKTLEFDSEVTKKKLVVNGIYETSSPLKVHVSHSLSVIDQAEIENIEDATVSVYENGDFLENLQHTDNGFYKSANLITENKNYELEIKATNYKTVRAKDKGYKTVLINSIDTSSSNFNGQNLQKITINFDDLKNQSNYYAIELRGMLIDTLFDMDTVGLYFYTNHPVIENNDSGGGFSDWQTVVYFSDILFSNKSESISLMINRHSHASSFELEVILYSSGKDYYQHKKSKRKYYTSNGDHFAQPVQVFSNIENGYGIFAGYAKSSKLIKLK